MNHKADLLLSHGYHLEEDPHEREVMMPFPPLGLLYISSHLKACGFSVEVHDMTFSSFETFVERLSQSRPTILGLYCNLLTRPTLLHMIRRGCEAGAFVVLGGPEAAPHAQDYLERGADIIVAGEGEVTLEALMHHLPEHGREGLDKIPGIIFLDEHKNLVHTKARELIQNLDAQPWPDRDAIDFGAYLNTWQEHHGHSIVSLITSRGCPYTCQWCSHAVFGRSHRRRSPASVCDEIEHIITRFKTDRLWFADDVFTLNRKWVIQLANELAQRKMHISFECVSRADRINEDVADALQSMGCHRLWIGAESGSQHILDEMKRLTLTKDVRDKTRMLKQRGIEVGMFIMLGYEGETEEDLRLTIEHLKETAPDIFLTTVSYPIKGTDYYDRVIERLILDLPWHESTDRDHKISGRQSDRYYHWATRWMVNSVHLHRELAKPGYNPLRLIRHFIALWRARIGMFLRRNDLTGKPAGRGWSRHEAASRAELK